MKKPVTEAQFIGSATLAVPFKGRALPEFAFAGRSNVGKSSLINLLTGRTRLAHVSATPGKTQTINYYLADNRWYLVDLPGYGYARRGKDQRKMFSELITHYLLNSPRLCCVFVLLDPRLEPQPIDLEFINWLGENEIPLRWYLQRPTSYRPAPCSRVKCILKNPFPFTGTNCRRYLSLPPARKPDGKS